MSKPCVLYAWHLRYFSGNTRCYPRYKDIPYVEKPIDITRRNPCGRWTYCLQYLDT